MKLANFIGIFVAIMIGTFMVSATLLNETEVRDIVCNDINLTGTNCTDWWGTLTLESVDGITNLNVSITNNVSITYIDNSTTNDYGNYTTVYSNFSEIDNRTTIKNYYNFTGNYSEFNAYTKSEVDNKVSGLITTADVDTKLSSYALKTEVEDVTNTEVKNIASGWKWAFGINIFITLLLMIAMFILFQQ